MKNRLELTIPISPKLLKYLQDTADLEGFGFTEGEVAKRFVWDGINVLIESGRLGPNSVTASSADPMCPLHGGFMQNGSHPGGGPCIHVWALTNRSAVENGKCELCGNKVTALQREVAK